MIHLQSNNKQQVITDGNPYLCEDCILGADIAVSVPSVSLQTVPSSSALPNWVQR